MLSLMVVIAQVYKLICWSQYSFLLPLLHGDFSEVCLLFVSITVYTFSIPENSIGCVELHRLKTRKTLWICLWPQSSNTEAAISKAPLFLSSWFTSNQSWLQKMSNIHSITKGIILPLASAIKHCNSMWQTWTWWEDSHCNRLFVTIRVNFISDKSSSVSAI